MVRHLFGEHVGSEIFQGDLELLSVALEEDLDSYKRVQRHWDVGSHGGWRLGQADR